MAVFLIDPQSIPAESWSFAAVSRRDRRAVVRFNWRNYPEQRDGSFGDAWRRTLARGEWA